MTSESVLKRRYWFLDLHTSDFLLAVVLLFFLRTALLVFVTAVIRLPLAYDQMPQVNLLAFPLSAAVSLFAAHVLLRPERTKPFVRRAILASLVLGLVATAHRLAGRYFVDSEYDVSFIATSVVLTLWAYLLYRRGPAFLDRWAKGAGTAFLIVPVLTIFLETDYEPWYGLQWDLPLGFDPAYFANGFLATLFVATVAGEITGRLYKSPLAARIEFARGADPEKADLSIESPTSPPRLDAVSESPVLGPASPPFRVDGRSLISPLSNPEAPRVPAAEVMPPSLPKPTEPRVRRRLFSDIE